MASAQTAYRPEARSDGLVIEDVGDETIVYDSDTHRAQLLAGTTLKIWRLCDGERQNTDIADALDGQDASLIVVDGAIAELEACDLMERAQLTEESKTPANVSLRAFLTNAVGASVFAGATIVTLDVPVAQNVFSIACNTPGDCATACSTACDASQDNFCNPGANDQAFWSCENDICVDNGAFRPGTCGCSPAGPNTSCPP